MLVVYRFGSSTRKGRNSVTFAETISTAGVDNTGLSLTTPEHGVLDYPNWLTALEHPPRYQHSLITTTITPIKNSIFNDSIQIQFIIICHFTTQHKYLQGQGYQEVVSLSSFGSNNGYGYYYRLTIYFPHFFLF